MYKAKTFEEILLGNKHSFDSSHIEIKRWINSQNKDFRRALIKSHGYNRVVSMFDFDKLSILEGFKDLNSLCIVSGSENELETNFLNFENLFTTSLIDGYDLTEDWGIEGFKNREILNSFDLVMCNQVLEHVPDPIKAFNNLVLMAKSGGYVWVSIPIINRIHSEPNFYSSGYHPRYLKFLADTTGLETIYIGAWGSLKYKLFAVSRNWPPYRKLKIGLRSNSDLLFPKGMFMNGAKLDNKHLVETWGLFRKL